MQQLELLFHSDANLQIYSDDQNVHQYHLQKIVTCCEKIILTFDKSVCSSSYSFSFGCQSTHDFESYRSSTDLEGICHFEQKASVIVDLELKKCSCVGQVQN